MYKPDADWKRHPLTAPIVRYRSCARIARTCHIPRIGLRSQGLISGQFRFMLGHVDIWESHFCKSTRCEDNAPLWPVEAPNIVLPVVPVSLIRREACDPPNFNQAACMRRVRTYPTKRGSQSPVLHILPAWTTRKFRCRMTYSSIRICTCPSLSQPATGDKPLGDTKELPQILKPQRAAGAPFSRCEKESRSGNIWADISQRSMS